MSRIGKLPIQVPVNIDVVVNGNIITLTSGATSKDYKVSSGVGITLEGRQLKLFALEGSSKEKPSMFVGMDRSNINSIVSGLATPFKVVLEINGVGYKALVDKNILVLTLGYSHEIIYALPAGIVAVFEKPNLIVLSGNNKVLVGQVASEIISFKKPEPYKGKGIKFFGKKIFRKDGKKK